MTILAIQEASFLKGSQHIQFILPVIIEIIYIKSYNANKTISAKQIRCKIFISGRVCKLLEISSLFEDGLVFSFSKEEVVVRTSGARPIARAPAFSPHTFFTRSKQSQESVWIEGRRARDLAARDVRTTKKGLKSYEKMPPS